MTLQLAQELALIRKTVVPFLIGELESNRVVPKVHLINALTVENDDKGSGQDI